MTTACQTCPVPEAPKADLLRALLLTVGVVASVGLPLAIGLAAFMAG